MTTEVRLTRSVLILYTLLLVASFAVRANAPMNRPLASVQRAMVVPARRGTSAGMERVRLAYRDAHPADNPGAPAVVLLHGSPGLGADFDAIIPTLSAWFRVIVPDLPGFGSSTRDVPDYSLLAHAAYVVDLLDRLDVRRAHVVGFSMGGGVALNLIDRAPERVRSLTMLSAIGVQEMELLGEYRANHVLHGVQLAALWMMRESVPHFGWLDGRLLAVPYARNFFDSDQRPLRAILMRITMPTQLIHGQRDPLVPVEAAIEHSRLVPHSELLVLDGGHFILFRRGHDVAAIIERFINRVERGEAVTRDEARAERVAAALRPFNAFPRAPLEGIGAAAATVLLATSALISVDLAWIAGGMFVGSGRLALVTVAVAVLLGTILRALFAFALRRQFRTNYGFEWRHFVRALGSGAASILVARITTTMPPLSTLEPTERAMALTLVMFLAVRLRRPFSTTL